MDKYLDMFVLKSTYNKALEKIEELKIELDGASNFNKWHERLDKVFDRLVDKQENCFSLGDTSWCTAAGELVLPDHVPVYVDDYFGGKVIKQEATPVTILDENGKATYALTANKPTKGKAYLLVQN